MSNIKFIGQGVRGLRLPKIGGFPMTLNVALTTVLRTNVLHCEISYNSARVRHTGEIFASNGGFRGQANE